MKWWKRRIDADPNIDLDVIWGEKGENYVFPWEDVWGGMPKATLWVSYKRCLAFQANPYCLTTRLNRGKCEWEACRLCDVTGKGKPVKSIIQAIVNRKVAEPIATEKVALDARSREKAYHVRVLFETQDPIYRFVNKNYFSNAIPRALMRVSDKFNDAFVGSIGHARIAAGANQAKDWTFGRNIYDFSLCEHMSESELRSLIEPANEELREGKILDIRMDTHMTVLRNDVDYAVYSMLIPNSGISHQRLRSDIERYFERQAQGKDSNIRIKKAQGKGVFVTVTRKLDGHDVRQVTYEFLPEHRGTLVRFVVSANYNPLSMLEALTGRKAFTWKQYPIHCDGYVQIPEETGDVDVFASLFGEQQRCKLTDGPLEADLFSGAKMASGVSLPAEGGLDLNFPVDVEWFYTKELQAAEVA